MAEDYCSSWSAWKIWRHPKIALETLIDSGFMQENLESQLQEALCALENSRLESRNLSEQNAILARKAGEDAARVARLEKDMEKFADELAETRRTLDAANAELAERKDVETQLKEFDEKLSRVEQLKADYENKIATLRKQLDDANIRLRQKQQQSGDSDLLDSDSPSPSTKTGIESNAGLQTRNGEYKSKKIRMKEPDDDWLLDTPDNLI